MAHQIRITDPVEFATIDGPESGFVAAINRQKADVVTKSGLEYTVPLRLLRRQPGVLPMRVFTADQITRCSLCVNDTVTFDHKGKTFFGSITHLNPKRARVTCGDDEWHVPYMMLNGHQAKARKQRNLERLTEVARQADQLLEKYGLTQWRFVYDHANHRAGSCRHDRQLISMAEQFCLTADNAQIEDTILHEIAHALVGVKHGHDVVWQAKAREIGCSAARTHCVSFSQPRYIVSCKQCGTYGVRDKRGKNRVCKRCLSPITYDQYTEELWDSVQAAH